MTKDEAFEAYAEALAKLSKQAQEATEQARNTLRARLKALRTEHHEELKAIRVIEQKTR